MIKLGKKLVSARDNRPAAETEGTRKAKDLVPEGEGFYAPREPAGETQQPQSEPTDKPS